MKKAWILNHYAIEPNMSGGTRHFNLAKYLKQYGWDVILIASSTMHNNNIQKLNTTEKRRIEIYEGVSFLWLKTSAYVGNGIGRIKNMLEYSWAVLQNKNISILNKPDIIIGSSVHPFAVLSAYILAKRYKVPFIFEVRDLWPQTLIDMKRIKKNGLFAKGMRQMESFLYKKANCIVTLLPYAYKYIENMGIERDKIVYIPNGANIEDFNCIHNSHPSDTFTLMYMGAMGEANNLQTILYAANILQTKSISHKINFRLIGDGPFKQSLINLAAKLKLSEHYVSFENSIPKIEVPGKLEEADACIIVVKNLPDLYRYGISMNKIFDYMAAGKPIIIAHYSRNNPIYEAQCGITSLSENPEDLANSILELLSLSKGELHNMELNGRKYVEQNHNYKILAERLANIMNNLINV